MAALPAFTYTPPQTPGHSPPSFSPSLFARPRFARSKTSGDTPRFAMDLQRKLDMTRPSVGTMTQPNSPTSTTSSSVSPTPTYVQERKAAEMEAQRVQAEEELKANGGKPDEAQRERVAITELCAALNVEMKEINPDGHCLYAAVADQLNVLGKSPSGAKLDYQDTRKATAEYMRTHAEDFMPFISDSDEHMAGIENKEAGTSPDAPDAARLQQKYFLGYCDAVERTGVWGGQPEILALSRAFHAPIHVVQAGCPVVKVGTDEARSGRADDEALMISYHRHMYGLGEHYNSLHKRRA